MANRLAYFLRRAPARDVAVNFDQVAELIGAEKAETLCLFHVSKQEIRTARVGRRSAIPPNKRQITAGLAQYNRKALLAAIYEAQGEDFQITGDEPIINPQQEVPNANLLPEKKRMELVARGLIMEEE